MRASRFTQLSWAAAMALSLAACGGSSDNASPGSLVVEVPVEGGGGNNGGNSGGNNGGNSGGGNGGGSGDSAPTVTTVIPADVEATGAFTETSQQIGGKTVMEIDSSKLTNGLSGVTLGNDFVFVLKGRTPLRVSN